MTKQEAVTEGQRLFAEREAAGRALLDLMARFPEPFDDAACNAEYRRAERRLRRQVEEDDDIHDDIYACIRAGDVTIQFGGGK